MNKTIKRFILPKITKQYLFRLLLVAVLAYIFFSFLCLPFRIKGHSMNPTYQNGNLFVNQTKVDEPYVRRPSDWNLALRRVDPGHVYVIGDNRSVPMHVHQFGQTPLNRIIGAPLW